ncbi:hypothetical protein DN730_11830 [Marinomonas piezotolerans]|uniref:Uncharacterized protein n=1 Tax=Marinomonas piezotolerans TaxID=2213058 RepID=A0A370U7Y2_9GAMM|nr:hypothetical protein [Marinomonas piezotolerans]RDL43865.1 hypothetical protein DN730_11830 [Marinomonas piezotolerans]
MNKSKMLSAYKTVNNLSKESKTIDENVSNKHQLYRSEYDEKLIKEYHFAKFRKNLDQIQNNKALAELLEKEHWSDEDIKTLLAAMR